MKETIKINLDQRLFDFDVDAYEALKNYLDSLRKYFLRSPQEADEILQDIEQRVADILEEKVKSERKTVTLEDITEIINKMGTVEDFASESEVEEKKESSKNEEKESFSGSFDKSYRKLYRDVDNNILGGVCSGLAAYFNIDPVWIRLIWVGLFFLKGIGLLAYLIMWIVVPAARTNSQKLEMQGIPVTVENIKQMAKNEFRKVKDNLHSFEKSDSYRRIHGEFADVFTALGRIVLVFIKIIAIVIGAALVFAGIGLIIGLLTLSSFSFHNLYIQDVPVFHYFQPFLANSILFIFALMFLILIPVVAILTGLIRLLFNIRTRHHFLSAFAWVIWILSLIFVIFTLTSGISSLSKFHKTIELNRLNIKQNKTLYISFRDENKSGRNVELFNFFGKDLIHDAGERKYYLHPSLRIKKSSDSDYYLQIERTHSLPVSADNNDSEGYIYKWDHNDTALILNTNFNVDEDKIWQLPKVQLTLLVPEGKKILVDKAGRRYFLFDGKMPGYLSRDYFDKVLIIKNGELRRYESKTVHANQ